MDDNEKKKKLWNLIHEMKDSKCKTCRFDSECDYDNNICYGARTILEIFEKEILEKES